MAQLYICLSPSSHGTRLDLLLRVTHHANDSSPIKLAVGVIGPTDHPISEGWDEPYLLDIPADQELDMLVIGPRHLTPGQYNWTLTSPTHPHLNTTASITITQQDLPSVA